MNLNKNELIKEMAARNGLTQKDNKEAVETLIEIIKETVVDEGKVQLSGFGVFEPRVRAAREGRNPRTNEVIQIPETKSVGFKVAKAFKESLN